VGGVASPAAGTLALSVRASDDGAGLASAEARVDGAVVASVALGGAGCASGDGCPASVEDLALPVATATFPDGTHQLQVSVADAAGNRAVLLDQALVFDNTPPVRQSTVVLTLGSGEATDGPGGGGAGGGGTGGAVGGAGGTGSAGGGPFCRAPRLSMFLKDKPLRLSRGVPVLRRNARYRFGGTLTCASGAGRVRAPAGVVVGLRALIGRKTYKKSGAATRAGGVLSLTLSAQSSRLLEFRYTSVDGAMTRVRIRVVVSATGKATKQRAVR
jgi:hypothetical protein